MYGFPLTVYALTRVFRLDVSGTFWDGNLWIYLTGTQAAMLVSMIIGYSIAFFGIGLVTTGWREVYRARGENRMTREVPYVFVRHPQYTGIFLVMFGEGVVHWPTIFSLAAFPNVVIAYLLLARKEERQMLERFGEQYREYQKRVPMVLPRRREWRRLFQVSAGGRTQHVRSSMDADAWQWVAIVAFLAFCCLPMLFMGRRNTQSGHGGRSHGPDKSPQR